jgi:hypothetical protein
MTSAEVRSQLAAALPEKLVDELLQAHAEAKRNLYLGGLRLSEVEAGRFCEAAFRLLEFISSGKFTTLGKPLNTDLLIEALQKIPSSAQPDSIRIHIPRALRSVYDIRNKRDAAHLADGIDPNLQDATLVTSVIDWVLAEFVRLYHLVTADTAQKIVTEIVTRAVPVVQDFDGFPKLLKNLGVTDHCLVLLYQRGDSGATFEELSKWVRPPMRANIARTLTSMVERKDFAHLDGSRYKITRLGQREAESNRLLEPVT